MEGEETIVEEIRRIIVESPQKIEAEKERSGNHWLACLNTRLSMLNFALSIGQERGEINSEQYQAADQKFDALVEKVHNLQQQYGIKEDIPDELKNELLSELGAIF